MRTLFLFIGLLFLGQNLFAQKKMSGIGAELSVLSLKPTARWWISKTTGFDVFGGISAEFEDFKPNDYEGGAKYLKSFLYNRTERTYFGISGKWKRVLVEETSNTVSLPVLGLLIGKEWYKKRTNNKGFAIEVGYQYGKKDYDVFNPVTHIYIGKKTFNEFPMVLNLRYTFYKAKR